MWRGKRKKNGNIFKRVYQCFRRRHATLHLAVLVGRSVRPSVGHISELRAVFTLPLLPNCPPLDCRVSGLVYLLCPSRFALYSLHLDYLVCTFKFAPSSFYLHKCTSLAPSNSLSSLHLHFYIFLTPSGLHFSVMCTQLYNPLCWSVGR